VRSSASVSLAPSQRRHRSAACHRLSWNTKCSENSTFPSLRSFALHQLPSIPLTAPSHSHRFTPLPPVKSKICAFLTAAPRPAVITAVINELCSHRLSWNTKRSENSTFPSLRSFALHQLPSIPLTHRLTQSAWQIKDYPLRYAAKAATKANMRVSLIRFTQRLSADCIR